MAENYYRAGDPIRRIDPEDLNYLRCLREDEENQGAAMSSVPAPSVVNNITNVQGENCRAAFNASGEFLKPCDIVGLPKNYARDVSDRFSGQQLKQNPLLTVEKYDEEEHGCSFGVVVTGGGPGCTANICICGLFEGVVEIMDDDHCYAKPQNDSNCFVSTKEPNCLSIVSRTEPVGPNDKAVATLKFRDLQLCEDCGLPPNSNYCGIVIDADEEAGTAIVEFENAEGETEEIEVELKGGGEPEIGEELQWFLTGDCRKVATCKKKDDFEDVGYCCCKAMISVGSPLPNGPPTASIEFPIDAPITIDLGAGDTCAGEVVSSSVTITETAIGSTEYTLTFTGQRPDGLTITGFGQFNLSGTQTLTLFPPLNPGGGIPPACFSSTITIDPPECLPSTIEMCDKVGGEMFDTMEDCIASKVPPGPPEPCCVEIDPPSGFPSGIIPSEIISVPEGTCDNPPDAAFVRVLRSLEITMAQFVFGEYPLLQSNFVFPNPTGSFQRLPNLDILEVSLDLVGLEESLCQSSNQDFPPLEVSGTLDRFDQNGDFIESVNLTFFQFRFGVESEGYVALTNFGQVDLFVEYELFGSCFPCGTMTSAQTNQPGAQLKNLIDEIKKDE